MIDFICCTATVISLMASDLSQTADFTRHGVRERNPIVSPFVGSSAGFGEAILGAVGLSAILYAEYKHPWWEKVLVVAMLSGHTWGVINNKGIGYPVPVVVFPMVVFRW